MRNSLVVVLYLMLLVGCATTNTSSLTVTAMKPELSLSQQETWKLMVGKWYGSQPIKDGGSRAEIMEKAPEGTYKVVFRIYQKDGSYKDQTEVGHWGVSGPIYFSIFRGHVFGTDLWPSDPGDPYNYDAYKIIQLTNDVFEYEHFGTGNRFVVKRVSADFDFPK